MDGRHQGIPPGIQLQLSLPPVKVILAQGRIQGGGGGSDEPPKIILTMGPVDFL